MTTPRILPLDALREAILAEGGTWTPRRAVDVFADTDRVPNTQRTRRMLDSIAAEGILAAQPDRTYELTDQAALACEYHWLVTLQWTSASGTRVTTVDGTYVAAPRATRAQVVTAVLTRAADTADAPDGAAVLFLSVEPNTAG
ncbi:hypothetical protein B4N89_02400 [Embleya scabrispora]|uniref:Uncharacterized protein n=1 Tax=Embleya scabrispora TaxID=159449 RepID=A0A1T3NT09_9ACTN|nr:hypothetical protein [Embleya scabrispora]OPC79948.1 hypothetical protein B4N89_02400 [Embleya scabrispora]